MSFFLGLYDNYLMPFGSDRTYKLESVIREEVEIKCPFFLVHVTII